MKKAFFPVLALCVAQALAAPAGTSVATLEVDGGTVKLAETSPASVVSTRDPDSRLVVYPEYPEQIERDYAYAVTVTQGDSTTNLVVYNHTEKSPLADRTHGGDVNRRFCEFAFAGDSVRVDIRVCEDVHAYKVFPSRLRLQHSFDGENGVISVWLDEPHNFGIQLNDYDKTILSVLVDEPEDPASVPNRNDPTVLYVDGWMDPQDMMTGVTLIDNASPYTSVYIAPGAVLNSRLYLNKPGVHVHGRGLILDPFSDIFRFDQVNSYSKAGVLRAESGASDALVEDVKLVDSRTYNYVISAPRVILRNIRAFSSMMCSDGVSAFRGLTIDGGWIYVGDNGLVIGNCPGGVFRDVAIGTSCKAIYIQDNNLGVNLCDIDAFRCDEGLVNNSYNPKTNELNQVFFFKNLSGVDCTLLPRFFAGSNMGTLPKTFGFENVSIPQTTGSSSWKSIGKSGPAVSVSDSAGKPWTTCNYALSITNLWVAGRRSNGFADSEIINPDRISISVVNNLASPKIPAVPNRADVNWTCPWKRTIGSSLQRDVRLATPEAGETTLEELSPYANLLEDRDATRSVWQRSPSWQVKLDATTIDPDDGARIYRARNATAANTGMYCDITDGFLRRGNGTYSLSFDARADLTNDVAEVTLQAQLLSNEKTKTVSFTAPNDGQWHTYTADIETSFDMEVTDLVGLHMRTPLSGASEIDYKNLSLTKAPPTELSVDETPGYDWTNRVVTISGFLVGTQVTLTLGGASSSSEPLTSVADSTGTASFDLSTTPGALCSYDVFTGGVSVVSGIFLSGGWDDSGSWFLAEPDGFGGAVETNGTWTTAPATTNATHFVPGESAAFSLSPAALAEGSNRLFRADATVAYPHLDTMAGLQEVIPSTSLAAVTPVKNPDGGDARWAAYVDGAWRMVSGGPVPESGADYVVRLEGDFAEAASPRIRLSVSGDDGATFGVLSDAATGAEWFAVNDETKRGLSNIEVRGPLGIASLRGALANAAVAEVNGVLYTSLADALRAAGSGGTVTLLTNATAPASLVQGRTIVTNGHLLVTYDDWIGTLIIMQ